MNHRIRLGITGLLLIALIYSWGFVSQPIKVLAADSSPAKFQQFEHGFMTTLADGPVTVLTYTLKESLAFEFAKVDLAGLQESQLPDGPPAQDYKPGGDFGKVWSNIPDLQKALGWAITPQVQYSAVTGAASGRYMSLPDGNFDVKLNAASIVGMSDTINFSLLNGATIRAGQSVWVYDSGPTKARLGQQDSGSIADKCHLQRITFPPGSYSVMVEGAVGPECPAGDFVLEANAKQKMTVLLFNQSHPVTGIVTDPDGTNTTAPAGHTFFDAVLPSAGDYKLHILADMSAPEPKFQDENAKAQYQYGYYTLPLSSAERIYSDRQDAATSAGAVSECFSLIPAISKPSCSRVAVSA